MALNLNTAMDSIGAALGGITGLRVFDYVPDSVSPPVAIVGWPDSLEYDNTMKRGFDRATFKVHVLVGKVSDRTARDALNVYASGTGSATASVKAALDALGSHARVERVTFSTITVAGTDYAAATFDVDWVQ